MKNTRRWLVITFVAALVGGIFFQQEALGIGQPAVTLGSNPIISFGGSVYISGNTVSESITTAPSTSDLRITDIQISVCCDNYAYGAVASLETASGTVLGAWTVNRNTPMVATMHSGLILPAGEELLLKGSRNNNSVSLRYTISGAYVQP